MKISLFGYNRKETDAYFNYLNQSNSELNDQITALQEQTEQLRKTAEEYEKLAQANSEEMELLKQQIEEYQKNEADYQNQIDALRTQAPEQSQDERLGFIFAVAYRDMENKNKLVGEKIKEYANRMFQRMSAYRDEVSGIVQSVTEMQNQQREALINLCNDATKRLESLADASQQTIEDMTMIEENQGRILREIDTMVEKTIDTEKMEERVQNVKKIDRF